MSPVDATSSPLIIGISIIVSMIVLLLLVIGFIYKIWPRKRAIAPQEEEVQALPGKKSRKPKEDNPSFPTSKSAQPGPNWLTILKAIGTGLNRAMGFIFNSSNFYWVVDIGFMLFSAIHAAPFYASVAVNIPHLEAINGIAGAATAVILDLVVIVFQQAAKQADERFDTSAKRQFMFWIFVCCGLNTGANLMTNFQHFEYDQYNLDPWARNYAAPIMLSVIPFLILGLSSALKMMTKDGQAVVGESPEEAIARYKRKIALMAARVDFERERIKQMEQLKALRQPQVDPNAPKRIPFWVAWFTRVVTEPDVIKKLERALAQAEQQRRQDLVAAQQKHQHDIHLFEEKRKHDLQVLEQKRQEEAERAFQLQQQLLETQQSASEQAKELKRSLETLPQLFETLQATPAQKAPRVAYLPGDTAALNRVGANAPAPASLPENLAFQVRDLYDRNKEEFSVDGVGIAYTIKGAIKRWDPTFSKLNLNDDKPLRRWLRNNPQYLGISFETSNSNPYWYILASAEQAVKKHFEIPPQKANKSRAQEPATVAS